MGFGLSKLRALGNSMGLGPVDLTLASAFGGMSYLDARREGRGVVSSIGSGAADFATTALMGAKGFLAFSLVAEAPSMYYSYRKARSQFERQQGMVMKNQAFMSAAFNDTEQTYTMRQAGMAIAQRSRYNTQQAMMGNEAQYMLK